MQVPHRKAPNRIRELREQVQLLVRQRIGTGVICPRCGCTFATFSDKCTADLLDRCPGCYAGIAFPGTLCCTQF